MRLTLNLLLLSFCGWLLCTPGVARAQGERVGQSGTSGAEYAPLADRVPAVSGAFFTKGGRIELAPRLGLSLTDPFYSHLDLALDAGYHILPSLMVGVSGGYLLGIPTPVVVDASAEAEALGQAEAASNAPTYDGPSFGVRGEVAWAPIYGKMSLFSESFLHFDTFISGQVGAVWSLEGENKLSFGIGLGQRYFLNSFMALKVRLDAHFFELSRKSDEATNILIEETWQTFVTASIGVSFFLPHDGSFLSGEPQ